MQDLGVDKPGPYPLLQLAGAIVILAGLALAIYRGTRDQKWNTPEIPGEQRWFFDGPIATAVNVLRDIRNHLDRLVEISAPIPEELRKQTELLRNIKDAIEDMPSRRARRPRP